MRQFFAVDIRDIYSTAWMILLIYDRENDQILTKRIYEKNNFHVQKVHESPFQC